MAEKVKKLSLERDYKKYLYFIDGEGSVCQKPKSGDGESTVLVSNAVNRDNKYLYFIDKEGKIANVHVGYADDFEEKVTSIVDNLLSK